MIKLSAGAMLVALGSIQPALAQDTQADPESPIIVTGTRATGLRAIDSPAPVQVLDSGTLERAGSPSLMNALATSLPSLNTQAVGNDLANESLAARLRGVSPNHTLILVNGKRRHGTANLSVLSSAFQGGAAPDLNFIPMASVGRVEVLLDGAAAEYGSDAIAGVVNIILSDDRSGGRVSMTAGQYFQGDGETLGVSANIGAPLGQDGFLNLTFESRYHNYSNAGGPDARVERAIASGAHPEWRNLPGYPYLNRVFGDARYTLQLASVNAGYQVSPDVEVYAFGSYGYKRAGGWANFRLPTRLPQLYPLGFNPVDRLRTQDISVTVGARGEVAGWDWDLSNTYGINDNRVQVTGSANIDLFNDTGRTPADFDAGAFTAKQSITNLDLRRELDLGLSAPVTLALGAELRTERYTLRAGDPASRYKAGSQSFPGFSLTDAGSHGRRNIAAYGEVSFLPVPALTLDFAGRFEHFSDFGDTTVGKVSARYAVTPAVALRGTASTGFRAPTLAEAYYSATNVQPNSAFVQLPPNAPAARLIGIEPLSPEHSTNFSAGIVATLAPRATLSVDAYQISVRDRIVASGTLYGFYNGALRSAAVNQAIVANGNVLEPVPFSGINVFSNGIDTRTRGVDVVLNFMTPFAGGRIDWSLTGNYSETGITRIRATPAALAASGQSLFDKVALSTLETASPRYKIILAGVYTQGRLTISAKESLFGNASRFADPGDGNFYLDETGTALITDLDVSYRLGDGLSFTLGANNLFDIRPERVNQAGLNVAAQAGSPAVEIYPNFSAFGVNGGYYYLRLTFAFR
ncbi:TonB-dependent receptor [Sphingomonas sp. LB-2]|uniref:TonB-dependent receptor plug domain-containing protein n=1 Tax=Sphingomonas caeni TaxID=2984949 RepID=UPI00222FD5C3|nr:TonB-dependent receptor [Sphingomonas caeni]MCW3848396.1 TonB-dependent receptor [Sphingomonas caeni]